MGKILLITVQMDGYENSVIEGLKSRGVGVDYFPGGAKIHRSELTSKQRLLRSLVREYSFNGLQRKLEQVETNIYGRRIRDLDASYDFIFDFGGKANLTCLKLLREKYSCPFILYLWDDFDHIKHGYSRVPYYDRVAIFNQDDATRLGFAYRPNFYVSEYQYNGEEKTLDLFYKGTARDKKRAFVVEQLAQELGKDYRIELSLFVKGGYLRNIHRVVSHDFYARFCDHAHLNITELSHKYKMARVLLDIAYKDQVGLGLRPLEALACNAKLITTNPNIAGYDFYTENNIFILREDLSNIRFLRAFMDSPFIPYPKEILRKYSINGFLDDIFALVQR